MPKHISPNIGDTAFNCPHCGVLTSQYWYNACYESLDDRATPAIFRPEDIPRFVSRVPEKQKDDIEHQLKRLSTGEPRLETREENEHGAYCRHVENVFFSRCFNCTKVAIWQYDRLLYPALTNGPEANPDLPDEVLKDFREASTIVHLSPRGAAALLRLCVQKLCKHLGGQGKSIDSDIGLLVRKGLDPRIQKALDAVRVTGNNAVHPGEMNIADDPNTALRLFDIVNLIAERMISHPKHVDAAFDALPEGAKKSIARRDKKEGDDS